MMSDTIQTHSFLYYLTEVDGISWRSQDYMTNKMVHAVKGDAIKGYFDVSVNAKGRRYRQENIDEFIAIMMNTVAGKLRTLINSEFSLVPIPNSEVTPGTKDEFRTLSHARRIAKIIGTRAQAVPALRWKQPKASARRGGTRDPQVLFDNLTVVDDLKAPVILFDDVITTGAQMIASCRRLKSVGIQPAAGIVVGRATKHQWPSMIGWQEEEVDFAEHPLIWDDLFRDC